MISADVASLRLTPVNNNNCDVFSVIVVFQLPVFLKYSVRLKLLAQLVHK